jgi:exonuclease III
MKIVTWNCQQAFARKAVRVFADSPDIVVVQECSRQSVEAVEAVEYEGFAGVWAGGNPNRGMAVFARKGWSVRRAVDARRSDPRWLVPFEVEGKQLTFTLVAVWACAIQGDHRASYVGQIHKALRRRREWFAAGPLVMAGDFNSNAIFDGKRRKANHTTMVEELRDRYGVVSAYHAAHGMEHGAEAHPTFHLYRRREKPYHFDYVFVPAEWTAGMRVEIGEYCDWGAESDHCPVMVEVGG